MKLLADTNILIYDTIEDAEQHPTAAKIIETTDKIYIITTVLLEYTWVMVKKLGISPKIPAEKIEEYKTMKNTKIICEPPETITEALQLIQNDKANPREINDYIIITTAKYLQATIATYDKHLQRTAQKHSIPTLEL